MGDAPTRCPCGDTFPTYAEYLTHAYVVHGKTADEA